MQSASNHEAPPCLLSPSAALETPKESSFPFTRRSMLHDPECANSDTGDPIRDTVGLLCAQSSCGHGVRAGEEVERVRGGNGAVGFTAFVMRALPRTHQRSKEQLGVKRRQDGTSCKDEDDGKDVGLKWKHSQILEKEWEIL